MVVKPKHLIALAIIAASILGCKQETCSVSCGGGDVYYVAVGFTRTELNGTFTYLYPSNGSFKNPLTSIPTSWAYPSANDTSSDTLLSGVLDMSNGIAQDIELIIPTANDTYKVGNFIISGTVIEQLTCNEGGTPTGNPVGPGCNGTPYLHSYVINGTMVTIPETSSPNDTAGYIYIHK